ncbi:hypothetical protein RJ641_025586 [Dillenia turbinata]|uniref:Uncharacterized protein n=1 Tax=Dillenia turbinata TaxID=194707 RepID=A0AAN8W1T9_9MAGN
MEMAARRTEFVKTYSYGELGERLRNLRPERKLENNWFSLEELNERLVKLRKIEEGTEYFHPDHMSSAKKLKLELQKVRDDFKMSESDCGSARVQIWHDAAAYKNQPCSAAVTWELSLKNINGLISCYKHITPYANISTPAMFIMSN